VTAPLVPTTPARPPRKRRPGRIALALVAAALGGLAARNYVHYTRALGPDLADSPRASTWTFAGAPAPTDDFAVFCFHGNPGSAEDFRAVAAALAKRGRQVFALDRPGHGTNARAPIGLSLPEQASLLHETTKRTGPPHPAVVVGFSYGGPVALAYAEDFPKDVRALVLVAAVGDPGAPHTAHAIQKVVALPVLGPLIAWTIGPLAAPGEVEKGLAAAFAPDPLDPDCLASAERLWTSPWALRASACDWPALDASLAAVAARYGEIRCPVEVVVGGGDTLVAQAHGDFLRDHVPGARLTVVTAKNHMLPYTAPDAIAAAVERAAARAR
jgi:pimeloyl-ACP methyl ester carboxylesterase